MSSTELGTDKVPVWVVKEGFLEEMTSNLSPN